MVGHLGVLLAKLTDDNGNGKAIMKDKKQKTEEEDPLPLDIVYPHLDVASSSRGTNIRGQAHYSLRSLGSIQEQVVVVKKPYNMVKVTNAFLGLRAPKAEVGCFRLYALNIKIVRTELCIGDDVQAGLSVHLNSWLIPQNSSINMQILMVRDVFLTCLDHILSEVKEHKWALFYCLPKNHLRKGNIIIKTWNEKKRTLACGALVQLLLPQDLKERSARALLIGVEEGRKAFLLVKPIQGVAFGNRKENMVKDGKGQRWSLNDRVVCLSTAILCSLTKAFDKMYMSKEVAFKIHTKGHFEYDPLRYVNGSVSLVCAFTSDMDVFPTCLDHILFEVKEHKWALFYCLPKKSLEKGLKLLHTDNDVHSFFEPACFSSTPFTTKFKRKIRKSTMVGLRKKVQTCVILSEGVERKTKKGTHKGKENLIEDEGICRKGSKHVVTIYKRALVNRKENMVEDGKGQRWSLNDRVVCLSTAILCSLTKAFGILYPLFNGCVVKNF
ncbi:hypothetical protein Tco_0051298 [Tanacetum coccineum]